MGENYYYVFRLFFPLVLQTASNMVAAAASAIRSSLLAHNQENYEHYPFHRNLLDSVWNLELCFLLYYHIHQLLLLFFSIYLSRFICRRKKNWQQKREKGYEKRSWLGWNMKLQTRGRHTRTGRKGGCAFHFLSLFFPFRLEI